MSTASDMLAAYLAAEASVLAGKEVRFQDRMLRREDLPEIRAGRREWAQRVAAEQASAARAPTIGGVRFSVARMD